MQTIMTNRKISTQDYKNRFIKLLINIAVYDRDILHQQNTQQRLDRQRQSTR